MASDTDAPAMHSYQTNPWVSQQFPSLSHAAHLGHVKDVTIQYQQINENAILQWRATASLGSGGQTLQDPSATQQERHESAVREHALKEAQRAALDEFHGGTGWIDSIGDIPDMSFEERMSIGREDPYEVPKATDYGEVLYGEYPPVMKPVH